LNSESPTPYTYWVVPGKFLAGEHPGSGNEKVGRATIRLLLGAGVSTFIDLTEEDENYSYQAIALEEAAALNQTVQFKNILIPDRKTPTPETMTQILDMIDAIIEADEAVYVHCLGGIGRTGTVVGCYLVRHGLSGEQALQEIAHLRKETIYSKVKSPETSEQYQMVLNWVG